MVRCAMCDSPATTRYFIRDYGTLEVCEPHYQILHNNSEMDKKQVIEGVKIMLTRILGALNKHYIEIESYMGMPPMKRGKNMGKREGLKIAIGEVENELEALIKK